MLAGRKKGIMQLSGTTQIKQSDNHSIQKKRVGLLGIMIKESVPRSDPVGWKLHPVLGQQTNKTTKHICRQKLLYERNKNKQVHKSMADPKSTGEVRDGLVLGMSRCTYLLRKNNKQTHKEEKETKNKSN